MRRTPNKDVQELIDKANEQGWEVQPTGGSHYKFVPPDKTKQIVIVSFSPSNPSSVRDAKSHLRRSGLHL